MLEGTVKTVLFPNRGIVVLPEAEVVVKQTLPGQRIRFVLKRKRGDRWEGLLQEVTGPSPSETADPGCSLFPACGGCAYRSLPYSVQLQLKEEQMRQLLAPVLAEQEQLDAEAVWKRCYEGIFSGPRTDGYRNKMEYSFGDERKGGPLTLGLHRRSGRYDILSAQDCRIVADDYNTIVREVQAWARETGLSPYQKRQHNGYFRHLLVRRTERTGEILVALVTSGQIDRQKEEGVLASFQDLLLSLPLEDELVGILHIRNDGVADTIQSDQTSLLYGRNTLEEELLDLHFQITPFSFFQTNTGGAEVLYEKTRAFLGDLRDKTVFDLYSGTGTIAQVLAPVAKETIGVELVAEAVEAARTNALQNELSNCRFLQGDVLRVLDDLSEKPDAIVLDPPRDGVHPKALPKILSYGAEQIVYLSCKPTSLARDIPAFYAYRYHLTRLACMDLFPGTNHVETVVKLSQKHIDHSIRVELDLDEFDETPTELRKKATYKEIKQYILDTHGKKVSTLYISQIKRKCGLEVGKCYNKPKSERVPAPVCPPDKEELIMDALRHFKLID